MREFLRGAVRLHILHHATEGDIHGAWITTELAHHGYRISPGTLYPLLHRMEQEGLLTSRQDVANGRARRVYRATPAGTEALAGGRKAVAELAKEILGREAWNALRDNHTSAALDQPDANDVALDEILG